MSFCQKRTPKNKKTNEQKNEKKQIGVVVFCRFGTLQNRGSRVEVVTISRKCHKNDAKFEVFLCSWFLPENQVFGIHQERMRPPKCCILQSKLDIFIV